MIARLVQVLCAARIDASASEIEDALWLAPFLPTEVAAGAAPDVTTQAPRPEEKVDGPRPPEDRSPASAAPSPPTPAAPLVPDLPSDDVHAGAGAVPFRAPAVRALPNGPEVVRALRPLRKRVPSRFGVVYDENATVEAIARVGVDGPWLPVVRRRQERWLELALVLDRAESMSIWGPMVTELRLLLMRMGAFRDVRAWSLVTGTETIRLQKGVTQGGASQAGRGTKELLDPSGRRVILVVSDCVSSGWRTGAVQAQLASWGRSSPVALLQLLPEELWSRTALRGSASAPLEAGRPAAPNALLRGGASNEPGALRLPVVTLDARTLQGWANVLAGTARCWVPGVVLADRPPAPLAVQPAVQRGPVAERTGEERVRRFRQSASPMAQQLAELLSAAPLYQPVMRLVRQTMLPGATHGHLAEVFLGGLVKRTTPLDAPVDPDEVSYDFFPGVREQLRKELASSDGLEVLSGVSDFIRERTGQALDFRALLLDPGSLEAGPSGTDGMFAALASPFLRRLGGRYAELADKMERPHLPTDPPPLRPPVETHRESVQENGFWILVDGTEGFGLPLHYTAIAQALGRNLALHGFSLVTLGTTGIAHVVARAFFEVLERNGYSSGIHRIVNVGPKVDFAWGRGIAVESSVPAAAVGRANAVLFVGSSGRSEEVYGSAKGRIPAATLVGSPSFGATDFLPPPPPEWRPMATDQYCVSVAEALLRLLEVPPPETEPELVALLGFAEHALDQRELDAYNRRLEELADAPASAPMRKTAPRLVTDPRRCSHRLLGFQLEPVVSAPALLAALRAERRAVRDLWETRTFWFALEAVQALLPLEKSGDQGRAVAAECLLIGGDLEANPFVDPGGECKQLLQRLVERDDALTRARRLRLLARQYEELRAKLPSGATRTTQMTGIVGAVVPPSDPAPSIPEAETWFRSGSPGQRIVALGLLRALPDPAGFSIVNQCIGQALSPFEQYTALTVADRMLPRLDEEKSALLEQTILAVRNGTTDVVVRIDPNDASRLDLSLRILERLRWGKPNPALGDLPPGGPEAEYVQRLRQSVAGAPDVPQTLSLILGMMQELTGTACNQIFLEWSRDDGQRLMTAAVAQPEGPPGPEAALYGIVGKCFQAGVVMRVDDVESHPDYLRTWVSTRSELAVPVFIGTRTVGVLNSESTEIAFFTADIAVRAVQIASVLGTALDSLGWSPERPPGKPLFRATRSPQAKVRAPRKGPPDGVPPRDAPLGDPVPNAVRKALNELHAQMKLWPVWPPRGPFHVGDVGRWEDDGTFVPVTSLAELGLPFSVAESVAFGDLERAIGATVSRVSKGRSIVQFARGGGLFLRAGSVQQRDVADLSALQYQITMLAERTADSSSGSKEDGAKAPKAAWDPDWIVLTRVLEARRFTLLVSERANASVELDLDASRVLSTRGMGLQFIATEPTPVFFAAHGMRRRLFRSRRFGPVE